MQCSCVNVAYHTPSHFLQALTTSLLLREKETERGRWGEKGDRNGALLKAFLGPEATH